MPLPPLHRLELTSVPVGVPGMLVLTSERLLFGSVAMFTVAALHAIGSLEAPRLRVRVSGGAFGGGALLPRELELCQHHSHAGAHVLRELRRVGQQRAITIIVMGRCLL